MAVPASVLGAFRRRKDVYRARCSVCVCRVVIDFTRLFIAGIALLAKRGPQDKQIMGLEIVAVSLGLCTFVDKLRDTKLVIHCDNTGAEVLPRWCTLAMYSLL